MVLRRRALASRLVDLIGIDLFLGVGTCRKKLAIDARRRLRSSLVVVLRDPLVEPVAKLGELVSEMPDGLGRQARAAGRP